MTTIIDGSAGITYPNSSTQANSQVGFKNRVIDGGFIINQRGYTSGTSLSSGSYGHDRWKGGGSGGTYTFTQGSTGVNTTITITAGSIQQVIEGCNMPEGGTYTLSWTGTAQGKIAGGSYSSSPVSATGLTAGANCTIEFNTGTLNNVQVEYGSTATSFDYRPYGTELQLCQRYYQQIGGFSIWSGSQTTSAGGNLSYTMRASPTLGQTSTITITEYSVNDYTQSSISISIAGGGTRVTNNAVQFSLGNYTGLTSSRMFVSTVSTGSITLSAEL